MPPIKIDQPKTINFSLVGKLDNVNLGNLYGVGNWSYTGLNSNGQGSTLLTSNTPVDLNNDNVRGNLAAYAKTLHPNWSDSRIWHGVESMWTGLNMYGLLFNALGLTIGVNPPNLQTNNMGYNQGSGLLGSYRNQVGNGQTYSWDSNNNAFYTEGNNVGVGTTGLAHSGANVLLDPNTRYNFGNNRIGRKLGAAYDATTGTINTANLGRRSMRRLRKVLNLQLVAGASLMGLQQLQQLQLGNLSLSLLFPNLFPPGFSFNNVGWWPNMNSNILQNPAPAQPATPAQPTTPALTVRTNPYAQNAAKYGFNDANSITNLQKLLLEMGYDLGPTGADGKWGKFTEDAYNDYMSIPESVRAPLSTNNSQTNNRQAKPANQQLTSASYTQWLPENMANLAANAYSSFNGSWVPQSRMGGVLKAALGSQIKTKTSLTPTLDAIMNNPLLAELFLTALSLKLGKEITIDLLSAAAADPEMGLQLEMIAQSMMSQAAKHGAKLNYIARLRNKCPEGLELVYYAKGGRICSACMGKKLLQGGKPKYMRDFEARQAKKGCKLKK